LGTKDKGLIMKPNQEGMECWVDAAHASEWNNKTASSDPNTARSRTGYIITYAGCPMHWPSKMQTEIALSTKEAEYIALSQAMREDYVPKMRPRTNHLKIMYHHFREEVRKGTFSIYHTRIEDQIADIFTKPLPEVPFVKFREKMMGLVRSPHT
jgi:hypothetical protein